MMMIRCLDLPILCPFCRAKEPRNSKEHLKRMWKRIDEYNDPEAINLLGGTYLRGHHGLSKNLKKAEELLQRSYDLGDPNAAYILASIYHEHIHDEARMVQYLEEGGRRGDVDCNYRLGVRAAESGNHEEAKQHLMAAACAGDDRAMENSHFILSKSIDFEG